MKGIKRIAAVAAVLAVLGPGAPDGRSQYAKFLTVADIQKVTGLKGVRQVPKSAEADGDVNFALEDGSRLLSATFVPASAFASARSSTGGFKSMIKNVGDEAFVGPSGGPPLYILVFRKGAQMVILDTELADDKHARIPIEQLTEIAKIMASRIQGEVKKFLAARVGPVHSPTALQYQ
jgi:hypothetical protein